MIELYNDSANRVFNIKLNIDGVEKADIEVRMILKFKKFNRSYVFFAEEKNKNYSITVPVMEELSTDDGGIMWIEAIAKDNIFKPWESDFTIKSKKSMVKLDTVDTEEAPKDKLKIDFQIEDFEEGERISENKYTIKTFNEFG